MIKKLAHTIQKTPSARKRLKKYGKSYYAAQCAKSRLLTKVIDTIIDID